MPREKEPLKRTYKGDVVIDLTRIFRSDEVRKDVIKEIKKLRPKTKQP